MNTRHLILLERSVDSMILGSVLDPLYKQHSVTANLIQEIYRKIFESKNTKECVWEIHYKYNYFSPERTFESYLEISNSKKTDSLSAIIVNGMYVESTGITIAFSGNFFKQKTVIPFREFDKIENKEAYLNGLITP